MTRDEIARELVAGCREGREKANIDRLYAEDAVSVEAADMGQGREVTGREAIHGKHDWFDSLYETVSAEVSDPMPHGDDRFAVIFDMKMKKRETGEIEDMRDIGVYHVRDGRIAREEFFYPTA
ncbi:nuclear transport factor 2 family protein [Jannaschia rubra]|uniref:Ketosteroid isomerase-related protein n=1 Tax=Jannaschia rubra TaxID=282197 RepID=A0A0M6XUH9_9RHOB|nr:nuclear transport factor 2 family protein [Jannaschia rubra]CTQ34277.1 Ketosteroid isomerase-related protein [Jannaschia rubra]SFG18964.1 Ketosteroid isomerase-related protein [Jannaschia rubra]